METRDTIKVLQRMVDKSDGDEFIALRSAIDAVLQVKAFEDGRLTSVVRCQDCLDWNGEDEYCTVLKTDMYESDYCSCGRRI